ncbi:MAG TPA: hypothetical protein VFC65_04495 [Prolixibacteraceae bacterium]|nr:hypothetical protein [Prolixibacteraceae bacterium]
MDDYIFIIIAVVISIFAAIKKNKKKTDEENPAVEEAERPRNFFMDQLLGEDFLEVPEEEVDSQARAQAITEKVNEIRSPELNPYGKHQMGFKSTLPEIQKRNIQFRLKNQIADEIKAGSDAGNYPGYLEDFSLRKAFVYSEIMNRKYISDPEY